MRERNCVSILLRYWSPISRPCFRNAHMSQIGSASLMPPQSSLGQGIKMCVIWNDAINQRMLTNKIMHVTVACHPYITSSWWHSTLIMDCGLGGGTKTGFFFDFLGSGWASHFRGIAWRSPSGVILRRLSELLLLQADCLLESSSLLSVFFLSSPLLSV